MSSKSRYIPALDGLRALAVAAVLLYHMDAAFLPSGLLGVTIFFVLSGYLITGLLIREWGESKTINLPRFWLRRVRRLFPAIAFVLAGTAVLTAVFAPDMLTKLRNDLVAALLWFTNWWYVFQDLSYFEAMGAPSPVTHFWSLAIEEQFYLIWPPVLLLLFRHRVRKKSIQRGILAACAVSALLMCVLYDPQGDPSRVYYGTDTRAFSLLIGAWLAFEFPAARVCGRGRRALGASQRKLVGALGAAALAGILAMMAFVSGYSPFLYYGGILVLSLLTGVLILALVDPANLVARFFALRPLVWVGKLSYSIYLWHYPLLLLMNPQNFTGTTPWYAYLGQVAVIVAVSAFSYYFVETPIRHGAIGRVVKEVRAGEVTWVESLKEHALQAGPAAALLLAAVTCCVVVPPTATQTGGYLMEEGVDPTQAQLGDGGEEGAGADAGAEEEPLTVEQMLAETPGETPEEKAHNTSFLMIGDSVSRALADDGGYGYFGEAFPNATLDAVISRHASAVPEVYQQHVDAGWDGPVVVFSIGTNGVTTSEQIAEMIDAVPADKRVFLVNIRTPQPLEADNNALLAQAAAERDNVELVDWYAASANHDEYFDGDGTHLTGKKGCEAYLALLTSALAGLYEE
ncbi:acyltransferase family protein [Adlercreutzia sp. ZJ242]|uniref:acyltransferase family protein n=1 Tax=Adlercreutzia sp. ZJ242 TaxID=2709409 RepID=UPI0013EBB234|nr:acyltransferase family protein [Adlercreutzia sp. ZJ242]